MSFSKDVTFVVSDRLTLVRFSSTKNSCSLIQPVKIPFTCRFFSICGHLVDIGPLVFSTSCLFLPSLDSIPLHSIPFFKPRSDPINICFQLSPFFDRLSMRW